MYDVVECAFLKGLIQVSRSQWCYNLYKVSQIVVNRLQLHLHPCKLSLAKTRQLSLCSVKDGGTVTHKQEGPQFESRLSQ